MAYRLLVEEYAGVEFRAVFVPKATGGRRPEAVSRGESHQSHDETGYSLADSVAPPDTGAGGVRSGGPTPLVDACEFVKRSHSGLGRFTSWGRKGRESLRRAGIAAERLDPVPGNWAFYTLTFPACADGASAAIADESGWIVQTVKNILRPLDHEEPAYFYVWERQQRGVLHLHYCHRLRQDCELGRELGRVNLLSQRLVSALSERTGVNLWVGRGGTDWSVYPEKLRVDYQRVRKGVGRYLAKYCAKGSERVAKYWAERRSPSPRRWWGCSQSLKDAASRLLVVRRYDYSNYLSASNAFDSTVDKIRLYRDGGVEYTGSISGCAGKFFSLFRLRPCKNTPKFMSESKGAMRILKATQGQEFSKESYSIAQLLPGIPWEHWTAQQNGPYRAIFTDGFREDFALLVSRRYSPSEWHLLATALKRLRTETLLCISASQLRLTVPRQRSLRLDLLKLSHDLDSLWRKIVSTRNLPHPSKPEMNTAEMVSD